MDNRSVKSDGSAHRWVEPILEAFGFAPENIVRIVHPSDEMFEQAVLEQGGDIDGGTAAYFASGAQIARSVERLLGAQERSRNLRVLDFGSGFGRVTRFFCALFGKEQVWASDLIEDAVGFQSQRLRCAGFVSAVHSRDVAWPEQRFDLVYVGSLFTHLPESTFGAWLEVLFEQVADGGMLLFSVHDQSLKPANVEMSRSGLAFVAKSEARDIEHDVYGSTWVTPAFLEEKLHQLAHSEGVTWHRYPRALCGYQDLVAVMRRGPHDRVVVADEDSAENGAGDGSRRSVIGGIGQIDTAELVGCKHDGAFSLRLSGWVLPTGIAGAVSEGAPLAKLRVQLYCTEGISQADSAAQAEGDCDTERDDLAGVAASVASRCATPGWTLDLRLPPQFSRGGDLLLVTAVWQNPVGSVQHVLFAGSLDRLLLLVTDEQYRRRRDRVFELAETIEQVKASRFWRLRRSWFRVKNRLGWTTEDPDGPVLKGSDRRPS